jgi:hypothetical protein
MARMGIGLNYGYSMVLLEARNGGKTLRVSNYFWSHDIRVSYLNATDWIQEHVVTYLNVGKLLVTSISAFNRLFGPRPVRVWR